MGGMPKTLKENNREGDNKMTVEAKKNLQLQSNQMRNILGRNNTVSSHTFKSI